MTWTELMILAGWKIFIVLLGAAGSGAAVAFGLFKTYGEKWLDGKFAERLEKLKHEQTKEIEGMRQKVQSTFSRISKIHDKEFEVLPKAWFLRHDAHGKAAHLMMAFKQYPDFGQLPELTFEAFLKESRLTDIQKSELRTASDRFKYGSERESDGWAILGGFLDRVNSDEFDVGHCQALCLQEQVAEVLIAAASVD